MSYNDNELFTNTMYTYIRSDKINDLLTYSHLLIIGKHECVWIWQHKINLIDFNASLLILHLCGTQ